MRDNIFRKVHAMQVARKDHCCTLCQKTIFKGNKFWRHLNDGTDRREHLNCVEHEKTPDYKDCH